MGRRKRMIRVMYSFAIFCLLLLSATLSGCKKEASGITIKDEDLDVGQSYFSSRYVAKGENGYYYFGGFGQYILYFDAATQEAIPLCSKAECSHDDSECMAYVGASNEALQIYFYNDKLYWLENNAGMVILVECRSDGSERKNVGELCVANDDTVNITFCNNYIYFTENAGHSVSDEDKTIFLKRMSLSDKNFETVYEYKGKNAVIQNLKTYSDEVYFVITSVEKTGEDTYERSGKGVFAADSKSNETRVVIDDNVYDYCIDTQNKYLYYYLYSDGLYRAKDENKEKIYTATQHTGFCNLTFDGEYVYMDNDYWETFSSYFMKNDYDIDRLIWVYDNGELKTTIDIKASGMTKHINGDSEYFFADIRREESSDKKLKGKSCFSKKEFFETGEIHWIEGDVE